MQFGDSLGYTAEKNSITGIFSSVCYWFSCLPGRQTQQFFHLR